MDATHRHTGRFVRRELGALCVRAELGEAKALVHAVGKELVLPYRAVAFLRRDAGVPRDRLPLAAEPVVRKARHLEDRRPRVLARVDRDEPAVGGERILLGRRRETRVLLHDLYRPVGILDLLENPPNRRKVPIVSLSTRIDDLVGRVVRGDILNENRRRVSVRPAHVLTAPREHLLLELLVGHAREVTAFGRDVLAKEARMRVRELVLSDERKSGLVVLSGWLPVRVHFRGPVLVRLGLVERNVHPLGDDRNDTARCDGDRRRVPGGPPIVGVDGPGDCLGEGRGVGRENAHPSRGVLG